MVASCDYLKTAPFDVTYDPEKGAQYSLSCQECGGVDCIGRSHNLPGAVVIKKFQQKGWQVAERKKKTICPKCQEAAKAAKSIEKENKMAKLKPVENVVSAMPSPRKMREIYSLLDSYFDEEAGAYLEDYSDERIAKETGMALQFITKTRVEAFGEITPPSELMALQSEIKSMRSMVDDLDKRVTAAMSKYK